MDNFLLKKPTVVLAAVILMALIPSFSTVQVAQKAYATSGDFSNLNVYVGYADNLRAGAANFPNPWATSPDVVYIGTDPSLQADAGAIRIDNTGGSDITIDNVNVQLGSAASGRPSFSLWGTFTIPAHSIAILTQTTQYDFDTSDYAFKGCGDSAASGEEPFPRVYLTIGSDTQEFDDAGHVLDTHGYDLVCISNESTPWTQIGSTTPQYEINLFEGGSASDFVISPGDSITAVASSTDVTIDQVTFRWVDPNGITTRTQTTSGNDDTYNPTTPGTWTVYADFQNGTTIQQTVNVSFDVVPESPIGAAALVGSSLAALGGFFVWRRNNNHSGGSGGSHRSTSSLGI